MASKKELEEKTFEELSDLASEKKVKGRSYMDKAELVDALADDEQETPSSTVKKPRKKTSTKKSAVSGTSSQEQEFKELLEEVAAHLNRPTYNGHFHGCPAATNPDKICACKARRGQELLNKIEQSLK